MKTGQAKKGDRITKNYKGKEIYLEVLHVEYTNSPVEKLFCRQVLSKRLITSHERPAECEFAKA